LEKQRAELRGLLSDLDAAYELAWRRTVLPNPRIGSELTRIRDLVRHFAFDGVAADVQQATVPSVIAQVRTGIATFKGYAAATDCEVMQMAGAGTIVVGSDPQREMHERNMQRLYAFNEANRPKYSPTELIVLLANRGITVQTTLDGKLTVSAAPGILTAADRDLLRSRKTELVQALNSRVEVF
jgi:hypothetical protein